jgi:diguanylate cyclase (GGDEF)-like protein
MSLVKQLWLAISLLMTLAFGGSLVVSTLAARHYLQQELQVKNMDNASALALSLTQLDKDPVTMALLVAAQFDTGHYRFIRIVSPTGAVLVEQSHHGALAGAPDWFAALIPIDAPTGRALIQDGWKQFGSVELASQTQYAYQSLWRGTLNLLLWFLLGGVVTGLLGTLAMRAITKPLGQVVRQAEAIAARRFLSVPEPRTPELRAVSRAMNAMVERLNARFAEESAQLESLSQQVNRDPVTGLSNRAHFLSQLRDVLDSEQHGSTGTLVLVRLADLGQLNAKLGHAQTDALLQQLAHALTQLTDAQAGQFAGRLKGAEFALLRPGAAQPHPVGQAVVEQLQQRWLPHWLGEVPELFHLAAVAYAQGQAVSDLLIRADQALAHAAHQGPNSWHAERGQGPAMALPAETWRRLLTQALEADQFSLAFYPVVQHPTATVLHVEGMVRLQMPGAMTPVPAGDFMPMAAKLQLTPSIDLKVAQLAIQHLQASTAGVAVAVNLSADSLGDSTLRSRLLALLRQHPQASSRLLFEAPEHGVLRHFDAFADLCTSLQSMGCQVGIEYFGQRFSDNDRWTTLGLDYLKVHPAYVRGIADNPGNQAFLRHLCHMAHGLGIRVMALGAENPHDLPLLSQLGLDGATGPGVTLKP